jgi:hypothetical protein
MMKHLSLSLWKLHACRAGLLSSAIALAPLAQAQVSLYSFAQSTQAYTEITAANGGYQLGTPLYFPPQHNLRAYADPALPEGTVTNGGYLSPAIGPGYPIGFNFLFNGDVFDRIGVANGGWISFGKSSDGNQAVWCYTSDHQHGRPLLQSIGGPPVPYQRNRIAGFGQSALRAQDQSSVGGPTSDLRIATIGTAPNRVCVIQWKNFRTNYSVDNNNINFQIRLNESDNSVDVRFGPMQWEWYLGGAGSIQVGLGGQISADFNNRMTVYQEPSFNHDWNATVAGVTNISACVAGNPTATQAEGPGVYPVVGLNFKWSAPVCPPPAWPLALSNITYESATISWNAVPGSASYSYVVNIVPDPNAPSPVASGTTASTSAVLNGLQPLTTYYVFIRSNCGGVPGTWGNATQLRTQGGASLVCGDAPLEQTHCSSQNTTVTWQYSTSDGVSPVRVVFSQGYVGNVNGGSFRIYDGANDSAPVIYTAGWGDVLPGQVFTSSGPDLFMKLVTDNGSCESQPWFTSWIWTVGCKDCTEALAAYTVVPDCANQQYSVNVLLVSLGSASSITIDNNLGVSPLTVSATGMHTVGPFPAGQQVILTLMNPDNELCNVNSVPLVNEPCAILDCGPTDYTHCYGNDGNTQWLYQGEGESLGIRFRKGTLGGDDVIRIHDAVDQFSVTPWSQNSGDLANVLRKSTNPQFALFMELTSNAFASCADGSFPAMDYVVGCHGGCTQPVATFTSECISANQYNVTVTISEIGSTGSASITNDAGAATVTATAAGTYTVGPFASQATVHIEVEGANALCSWTSPAQSRDCTGVGITEQQSNVLSLYPNPSEGHFRLDLPSSLDGTTDMRVLDLQGRVLVQRGAIQAEGPTMVLDLSGFPSGTYIVMLNSERSVYTGKVQVVH